MGNKFSFDVSDETAQILKEIKSATQTPYGHTINSLIEIFCTIPPDVNKELLNFCKTRIKELYDEMDVAGDYEIQTLMNKSQVYQNLAMFFNNGQRISIDSIESKPKMQKIEMLDSVLICPSDYIILNQDAAAHCRFASVVEVRNAKFGVPHFVYFHTKEADEYTENDTDMIENLCAREWSRFQEILDNVVKPIPDPTAEGQYLNAKEMYDSAQIGHYPVYVYGDSRYPKDFKPPMGTQIIRL